MAVEEKKSRARADPERGNIARDEKPQREETVQRAQRQRRPKEPAPERLQHPRRNFVNEQRGSQKQLKCSAAAVTGECMRCVSRKPGFEEQVQCDPEKESRPAWRAAERVQRAKNPQTGCDRRQNPATQTCGRLLPPPG